MIRIGIISPSQIAFKRFLPALKKLYNFKYVGIAIANVEEWYNDSLGNNKSNFKNILKAEKEKAYLFVDTYGGKVFESYSNMIKSEEIDAIYLPLPPALHYKWAQLAIKSGKHVLVEKPSTISLKDTTDLILLAEKKNIALHENYMFVFHEQLNSINKIIKSGKIGNIRLYKLAFGFPRRSENDFRYNKRLGGGALLDCGGYTLKYASMLLGEGAKIVCAQSNYIDEFDVDIFGSATLVNDNNITAQVSFGMDNSYKCDLEVWGSLGYFATGRVFTALESFSPKATIIIGENKETIDLPPDDTFKKSIINFYQCIKDREFRKSNYEEIVKQSELLESFHFKILNNK